MASAAAATEEEETFSGEMTRKMNKKGKINLKLK